VDRQNGQTGKRANGQKAGALGVLCALLVGVAVACGGSDSTSGSAPTQEPFEIVGVGRPQNRQGVGDVDRAIGRYEQVEPELIAKFQAQPWYKDGLTRDESLFVERSITFVARHDSRRRSAYVSDETIEKKLYRYAQLDLDQDQLEMLLVVEPGQDADAQFDQMKLIVAALEDVVGVQYPSRVITIFNGDWEINDFSDDQFIRIARCCVDSGFILAHELAHTYWSMGPSWFNEGMADIYAVLTLERLNSERPADWQPVPADLDSHYRSRKRQVESGRFPDLLLPRRSASDGRYEVADVFLLDIKGRLGEANFFAAARDLYLASDFGRFNLREKRIEDIFLHYAPDGREDDVMSLFNRVIWGDEGQRYQQMKELEGE
jgi:hypothetical protein